MKRKHMFLRTIAEEKEYLNEWMPERAKLDDISVIACALKSYPGLELLKFKLSTSDNFLISNKLNTLIRCNVYFATMNDSLADINAIRLRIIANGLLALKKLLKDDWVKFANVYGVLLLLEILPALIENGRANRDLSQECFESQLQHIDINLFKKAFEDKTPMLIFAEKLTKEIESLAPFKFESKVK